MAEVTSPAHARLGLAARRQKKKISLEDISKTTKISVRSLEAIESEDFRKLPGGVYNTNYIRQYAKAIESDDSEILALYYAVMGINPESGEPLPHAEPPTQGFFSRFLRHTAAVIHS